MGGFARIATLAVEKFTSFDSVDHLNNHDPVRQTHAAQGVVERLEGMKPKANHWTRR